MTLRERLKRWLQPETPDQPDHAASTVLARRRPVRWEAADARFPRPMHARLPCKIHCERHE